MRGKTACIGAFEAKTRFSELLAQVAETGAEFIITKHDRPVARLAPLVEVHSRESIEKAVAEWKHQRGSVHLHGLKIRDLIDVGRR
jgi:prevent-host-death family protein